jgi:hypothetical protein
MAKRSEKIQQKMYAEAFSTVCALHRGSQGTHKFLVPPPPFTPPLPPTFYFPFLTPVGTAFSLIFSLGPIFKSSYLHVLFITIQHKYLTSAYSEFSLYLIRMIIQVLQLAKERVGKHRENGSSQ